MISKLTTLALAAAVAASPFAISSASAETRVGLLGCHSDGSVGYVVGSSDLFVCEFTPSDGAPRQIYTGKLNTYGLDIGVTGRTNLQWAVLSVGNDPTRPNNLAGTYTGTTASASIYAGLGANTLVGGGESGFMLQPFSVQEQEGVNATLGVTRFELYAAQPIETGQPKAPVAVKRHGPRTVVPR